MEWKGKIHHFRKSDSKMSSERNETVLRRNSSFLESWSKSFSSTLKKSRANFTDEPTYPSLYALLIVYQSYTMKSFKTFETTTKHFQTYPELFVVHKNIPPPFLQEYIAPSNVALGATPRNTFQAAMKLTILMGQFFGLNPVLGVCEKNALKLRFTFHSTRCVYAIISIVAQGILAGFCFMKIIYDADSSLTANTSVIFFSTNCLTTALFLQMAMKWPAMCRFIAKLEEIDPIEDSKLIRRCNFTFITILALALVEHLLSDVSGLAAAMNCQPEKELLEAYILQAFPWIWTFLPYNLSVGVICKIISVQCTFTWNYSNAFIMCVSWYLISRLDQINQRILNMEGKNVPGSFWQLMREDYSRASHLVKSVNEVISGVIFVAFANNLFCICMQILHALEIAHKTDSAPCTVNAKGPLKGYEKTIYFVSSAAFLVGRSLAVCLIAAKVHSASRMPANTLYEVPSAGYCVEVERFLSQVHGDTVALTGYNFFNVTRGLVLVIGGTIVTYELVFMQFAGVTTVVPTTVTLADLLTGS